jgi:hypothetical protein
MCWRSWPRVWRPNRRRWCPVLDPLGPLHFSWEVTARALGGTRKALIRWRRLTNAISNRRICKLPRPLRTNKVAVWEAVFLHRASPRSQPFRELCTKKIGASWTWKVFIKGLKTLPITRVDRCGGLAGPTGRFTEIQQKRMCSQIPAQSPLFLALLRRSAAAKAQPAEGSLPIADQSSFERAGRSERTAQCP